MNNVFFLYMHTNYLLTNKSSTGYSVYTMTIIIIIYQFLLYRIFHLLQTLVFNIIILRNLEKYLGWLSTCILYMGSGVGGNVISGVFVPYSAEVCCPQ